MSLRSMRKAARFAASNLHSSRTQRSRLGIESRSVEVQDHHAVQEYAERLLVAQRMSTGSQRRLRNSVLSERFRCAGGQPLANFRGSGCDQKSTGRGADLGIGWEVC